MSEIVVPSGMVVVSWEEFFAYVGPRDIVLLAEPEYTVWETRTRHVVGRSYPGWRSAWNAKRYYMLERSAAREVLGAFGSSTAPAVRSEAEPAT